MKMLSVSVQSRSNSIPRQFLCGILTLIVYSSLSLCVRGIPKDQQTTATCDIDANGVEICQANSVEAKEEHVKQRNRFKPPVDSTFRAWEESHGYGASSKDRFNAYKPVVDDYDSMRQDASLIEPLVMLPLIKGVCPEDNSLPNCQPLTGSTGAAQENNQNADTIAINNVIRESEKYLKYKVLVDPAYEKVAYKCLNQHELCSYWASLKECIANPGYMLEQCSLACLSCEPK